MKILHIITGLSHGGAEKLLLNTCIEQNSSGEYTEVIYFTIHDSIVDDFENAGIKVTRYDFSPFYSTFSFLKLIHYIKKQKFDVVHTHLPRAAFIGRIAAIIAGCKSIANTFHRPDVWLTSKSLPSRIMNCVDTCLNNHKASQNIMISKAAYDFMVENEKNLDRTKLTIILNAIDFNEIDEKLSNSISYDRKNIKDDDFTILNVGWLDNRKGQIYLLQAIHYLISERKINNIKCFIVGSFGDCADEIVKFIGEHHMDETVILTGVQEHPYTYMKNSDLFVMSSISEGFGIVVLEAYYCGIPVISTNADGLKEIVLHKQTGIVVEKANYLELAQEIEKVYTHQYNSKHLTDQAKEFVQQFNIHDYVKKIKEVYTKTQNASE